jgi:sterol desaturase/sphingolipid hydroxylase (fatty acid hydroxylase superfamily)
MNLTPFQNPFLLVGMGMIYQYIRYLIFSGSFYGYFYILKKNTYLPRKIIPGAFKKEEIHRDLKMAWGFCLGVISVFAFMVHESTRHHFKLYTDTHAYPLYWIPLSCLGLIFGIDLYYYLWHRLLHHKSIFKYIHSWHHRAADPSPFSSFALHPLEAAILSLFNVLFIYLVPTHVSSLFIATFLGGLFNNNGHLGVESLPKSILQAPLIRWFISGSYHTIHHQLPNKNYGLYFKFWDKLFGTSKEPTLR